MPELGDRAAGAPAEERRGRAFRPRRVLRGRAQRGSVSPGAVPPNMICKPPRTLK